MAKVCNLPDLRQAQISDKPILKGMLEAYLSELLAFGDTGGQYPYFDACWQEADIRWPYLFLEGEVPVGLALVRAPQEGGADFSMAEFSIVPSARQSGCGCKMAAAVIRWHPGSWHVAIMAATSRRRRSGRGRSRRPALSACGMASTRTACSIALPSASALTGRAGDVCAAKKVSAGAASRCLDRQRGRAGASPNLFADSR